MHRALKKKERVSGKQMRLTAIKILCLAHGVPRPLVRFDDLEVFRGTATLDEARMDLDVRTEDFYGIRVHGGIARMYRELDLRDECALPRVVGGYSCGAVMALLRAVELKTVCGHAVDEVITIASPRFLHPSSVETLAARLGPHTRVHRIYNVDDAIVRLPPHLAHYGAPLALDGAAPVVRAHLASEYVRRLELTARP